MAEHHCQPLDDALAELAVLRLIHCLRPYLPSSPLPPMIRAAAWVPRQRQAERNAERRIRNLQAMSGHL